MARGLLTLSAGRAVVLVLQFMTIAVLAAHLEPSGLGVYTFGLAAGGLFRLIPNFGTVPVVTRDIAQSPERERELVPALLHVRAGLGVLAFALLAAGLAVLDFGRAKEEATLVAGLVVLVVHDAFRAPLEVRLRMEAVSVADIVEGVLTVAGTLLLARLDAGVLAFVWLYVGMKTFNAAIVMVWAMRVARFAWRPRPDLWGPLLRAAVPLGLAGVVMALYYRLDVLLLGAMKPVADVGQYGAAYRFLDAFIILPTITMAVLSPLLSRSVVEGAEALQRRYGQALHLVAAASLFVAVAGALTMWRVLPTLPGFGMYEGAGVALAILSPAAALIFVGTVVQGALISGHHQRRLLIISCWGLGLNVVLNLALIPPYSYTGAAIATTATEALLVTLSLRDARRLMGLGARGVRLQRLLMAAAGLAAVLAATLALPPLAQLALAAAAYPALLLASGAVRREDLRPFAAAFRRGQPA